MSSTEGDSREGYSIERRERARVLHGALDNMQILASDRARSTDSKAGFLAVTAGILLTGDVWHQAYRIGWWLTIIPMALSLVAIGFALWSLKVRVRVTTEPQKLVDAWLADDTRDSDGLLELLVKAKARDAAAMEATTTERIQWVKRGFYSLLAALVATLLLYLVENSIL